MGLAVELPVLKVNMFEFERVWLAKNVRRWCSFRARREHRPCSPAKRDAANGAGHRFEGPILDGQIQRGKANQAVLGTRSKSPFMREAPGCGFSRRP